MMQYLKNHKKIIGLFFLCSAVVFLVHFIVYQPILQYQLFLVSEDWSFLVFYRSLYPNPLAKLIDVWTNIGLHTTAQIYHIGILSDLLKFNYQSYQTVNVILKAIGTLSFFPLIIVLFKNKKLAFIATILFGMSSATAGSFLWIAKGSEYLGIALMNIFLITYYYSIRENSKKFLFLSSILILISYLMAPPRMFPLPILVLLVEIYWLVTTRKLINLKYSIIRMIAFSLPIVLISKMAPVSACCPFAARPLMLIKEIVNGNWQDLIDPFAGIGWTLVTNDFWKFFGSLQMETFTNFGDFLLYLIKGPLLIFGILTPLLSFILSKKPGKFFILVFGLNLFFEILMFFIAGHHLSIPAELVIPYAPGQFIITKYPAMVAFYIFIIAFACFLEWRKDRENNLLKAIWIGPIFSIIFLWPTWVIMGSLINDYSSVHWYFGIPAMGTTLLMAAILVLLYEKLKGRNLLRSFAMLIIFGVIFIFYRTHGAAIAKQYLGINPQRVSLKDQQIIHQKLISNLGESARTGNLLIYFDIVEDTLNLRRTSQYYKDALVINAFGYWVHFRRGENGIINDGCVAGISNKKVLESAVLVENDQVGFNYKYEGICINKNTTIGGNVGKETAFYGLDNFYAFRVKDGEFIDIKKDILKELGIVTTQVSL